MIINGSPRAPRSNSRRYAEIFARHCGATTVSRHITRTNHLELCAEAGTVDDLLLVFPLYADALPVTLLDFLKTLETYPAGAEADDVGAHQLRLPGTWAERGGRGHGAPFLSPQRLCHGIGIDAGQWRGHPEDTFQLHSHPEHPEVGTLDRTAPVCHDKGYDAAYEATVCRGGRHLLAALWPEVRHGQAADADPADRGTLTSPEMGEKTVQPAGRPVSPEHDGAPAFFGTLGMSIS